MSTLVPCPAPATGRVVAPRRRVHPALIAVVLATGTALGCALAVVAAVAAAPGSALLLAGVLTVAGWLVRTATTTALPVLLTVAGLAVLAALAPGLLLPAVLAYLALVRGGTP